MVRGLFACVVLVASTVALAVPAIVLSLLRPGSDATFRLTRLWARLIFGAAGVRITFEGPASPLDLPCIFMANHRSAADVWSLALCLPDSSCFVAKSSLFRIPFLGWAMSAGGFVPVDRRDRHKAIESLSVAERRLREGKSLIVFPEGTRSRDGRLGPFKKGPFHLAVASLRPVVPVAISGSGDVLPPGSPLLRPGEVRVRFGPPVDPGSFGRDGVLVLQDAVRRAILDRLDEGIGNGP